MKNSSPYYFYNRNNIYIKLIYKSSGHGVDGREERRVPCRVVGHIRVECQWEQFGKNMGHTFYGHCHQMRNIILNGVELGKNLLDDMKGTMEDQHQFPGLVIIHIDIFRFGEGFAGLDIVKRYTHWDTMDGRIFFIIHKG